MRKLTALFWDIGGVILSNGWDRAACGKAASRFDLDLEDFERRHPGPFAAFETGRITLDAYLDQTVFYQPRPFSRVEFTSFMFAQSKENREVRAILDTLTAADRYFLAAINNEGLELNTYRIREFGLARNLAAFFSSCYLGVRKPDEAIYRQALNITQRAPEECIFIDDRVPNLESARRLGIRTIHFLNPAQLRAELARHGVAGVGS
jgi:putative hydrolase of the HAD superfamily